MMRILRIITAMVFIVSVFAVGFGAGLCVKVFLVRGAPVIHGGGELLLLLAIPAGIVAGCCIGRKRADGDKQ